MPPAGRDEQAGHCDDLGVVGRCNAEVTAYGTPRAAVQLIKAIRAVPPKWRTRVEVLGGAASAHDVVDEAALQSAAAQG